MKQIISSPDSSYEEKVDAQNFFTQRLQYNFENILYTHTQTQNYPNYYQENIF